MPYHQRHRLVRTHALVAFLLTALPAALLAGGLVRRGVEWGPALLASWAVAVNLVAFGYYGFDKGRARAGGPRVPEVVLHGLSAAGGALGAYAGMRVFRHKTVKGRFQLLFWPLFALSVAALLYAAKLVWLG